MDGNDIIVQVLNNDAKFQSHCDCEFDPFDYVLIKLKTGEDSGVTINESDDIITIYNQIEYHDKHIAPNNFISTSVLRISLADPDCFKKLLAEVYRILEI